MQTVGRFSGFRDWINLSFVERERTPRQLMVLSIRLLLADLSYLNTVREVVTFGVKRRR